MSYCVSPTASFWNEGVFCVPRTVTEKSLKFSSELQLKALLLILSDGKACDESELAKRLNSEVSSVKEALDFWVDEGILVSTEELKKPERKIENEKSATKKSLEALPVPNLTPKDIIVMCSENSELSNLLRSAEKTLSSSLSNAMKSNIINMVTYYGLPVPVVITLLDYYKTSRDSGRNVTTRTLQQMAKEWANDGVSTLDEASKKLQELISCDELWGDVIERCRFDYRKPTSAQRKMLIRWKSDFDDEMIFFACNTMKKYTDDSRQSLKIVDNILKDWKRKGFKTPDDVKAQPEKEKNDDNKLKSKPSFDIEEIKKKSALNDEFDI